MMKSEYEKLFDLMVSMLEEQRKSIPKYIKVNQHYLNTLINSGEVKSLSADSEEISLDFGSYAGVPVVFDESLDTYKLVFE